MKLFNSIRKRCNEESASPIALAYKGSFQFFIDWLKKKYPDLKNDDEIQHALDHAITDERESIAATSIVVDDLLEAVDLTVEAMSKFQHPRWDTEEFAETEDGYNLLQALQKIQELSDKCK